MSQNDMNTPADAMAAAQDAAGETLKATADTTSPFTAFDPAKATEQMRGMAEKSIQQSQEAYARMKSQAEEAQKTMEEQMSMVRGATQNISRTTLNNMRAQTEAGFEHVEKLMGVTSLSELIEVQTAFLRQQAEMTIEQSQQLQQVTTKAMEEMSAPAKEAMEKAMDRNRHM